MPTFNPGARSGQLAGPASLVVPPPPMNRRLPPRARHAPPVPPVFTSSLTPDEIKLEANTSFHAAPRSRGDGLPMPPSVGTPDMRLPVTAQMTPIEAEDDNRWDIALHEVQSMHGEEPEEDLRNFDAAGLEWETTSMRLRRRARQLLAFAAVWRRH